MANLRKYDKYKQTGIEWIGEIPEHWERTKVKYLADYINGCAFKPEEWTNDEDNGIPIIRIQNLNNLDEDFNYYKGEKSNKFLISYGDVLISWSASLGVYVWKGKRAWLNQHIFKVDKIKTSKEYYIWIARKFIEEISHMAHGSTMTHLTKDAFGSFELYVPPQKEQALIADYLNEKTSQIDKLIANKQKLIELLKEERNAIINEAVNGKGNKWERKKLKLVARKIGDGIHATPEYTDFTNIYFINGTNLNCGRIEIEELTRTVSEEEYFRFKLDLMNGSILLSLNGSVGKIAFYKGEKVVLGKSVAYIEFTKEIFNVFAFFILQSYDVQEYFETTMSGTTIKNLSLYALRNTPVNLPVYKEQLRIVNYIQFEINRINATIDKIKKEIGFIQEYKSALISEVVTGKICII